MTPAVEEFYNRVHNKADGRFGTSGTGGGHYKGRAAGAKAPAHSKAGGSKAKLDDSRNTGKTLAAGKFKQSSRRDWAAKRSPDAGSISKARNEKGKVSAKTGKLDDTKQTNKTLKSGGFKKSERREWASKRSKDAGSITVSKNQKGAKVKRSVKVSAAMQNAYEFALKLV